MRTSSLVVMVVASWMWAGCPGGETAVDSGGGGEMDAPARIDAPEGTDAPGGTDAPSGTDAPGADDAPVAMDAPSDLDAPGDLDAPVAMDAPTSDDAPVVSRDAPLARRDAPLTRRDTGGGAIPPGECNMRSPLCDVRCLIPNRCVTECGGPVTDCGCCPCAAGSVNVTTCPPTP